MVKGILCIVAASLIFGVIPTANKYVMLSGLEATCVTFYTHTMLACIALILAKWKGHSLKVKASNALFLIFLGAVGMGVTSWLINSAMRYIPTGLATVLHFLYPTIVSIVMVAVFHQRFTIFKLAAILCSIVGMVLITNIGGDQKISVVGILLALCSSLTYSFYMIANDKGKINETPLLVKLVYSGFGSSLMFGLVTAIKGDFGLPGTVRAGMVLVLVCSVGSLSAFYFITAGIKIIGASTASFVNMLEPVTSVVVSTIVYHDVLGIKMVMGMALILFAVFLVAMDGRTKEPRVRQEA